MKLLLCFSLFIFSLFSVLAHTQEMENSQAAVASTHHASIKEAWASIQKATKEIENVINTGNLARIHEWQEKMSGDLNYLKTNSSQVVGDQAKRLKAALEQAEAISINLHEAADGKLVEPAKRELQKLKSALELVKAQYDKEDIAATNGHEEHAISINQATPSGFAFTARTMEGPLKVGEKAEVIVKLQKKDGMPVILDDLKEVHTKKIHLLMIDSSLIDYHHVHPTPGTKSGEYQFSFTPKKPGFYRIWADVIPVETDQEEYLTADLLAETKGEPITDRKPNFVSKIDDLTIVLSFDKNPLKMGEAALGKLKITNDKGEVFSRLEPVMGAYAHIVGFSEDYQTIAHVHPMGTEPTKESDRGQGELSFHLIPKKSGLIRLFAQIKIDGEDKFAVFTVFVPAEGD